MKLRFDLAIFALTRITSNQCGPWSSSPSPDRNIRDFRPSITVDRTSSVKKRHQNVEIEQRYLYPSSARHSTRIGHTPPNLPVYNMLFFVNYNDLLPFAIIYNRTMYNLPFAARRYTYYIIPWWRSFADDGSVFSISKCVRVDPRVYGEMLTVNKITPREKMNRKKLSPRSFPRRTTCETFARRVVCAYNMTETEREGARERVRG